jgi:hypothetical protein
VDKEFSGELFIYCGINYRTRVGFLGYKLNSEKTEPCCSCRSRKTCEFFKHCQNLSNNGKVLETKLVELRITAKRVINAAIDVGRILKNDYSEENLRVHNEAAAKLEQVSTKLKGDKE